MLFLPILLLSAVLSLPYVQCLGDDTFIYMRMIKNFIGTGLFEYNVGEPCYAMTSLTWFLAWSGATVIFGDMDVARYVLSIICHVLAFVGLYLLGRHVIRNRQVLALALVAICLDPFYLRWFWAGWEVSPKIAAAAWALYALVRAGADSRSWRIMLAGLATGLAFLTRPEMLIIVPIGLVYLGIRLNKDRRGQALVIYMLGCCVITLPWMFYAYRTFGWAIPHTVFAKAGEVRSLTYFAKLVVLLVVPYIPVYVLAAWSLWKGMTSRGGWMLCNVHELTHRKIDVLLLLVFGGGVVGYPVFGSFLEQIKLALFTPFLVMAIAAVIDWAVEKSWVRMAPRLVWVMVLTTIAMSLTVQARWLTAFSYFNANFREGEDCEFIAFANAVKRMTPPTATIGLWELGVVGYFSERNIVDFAGLATPELARYRRRVPLSGNADRDGLFKRMPDYVNEYVRDRGRVPDYIVECVPQGDAATHGAAKRELFGRIYEPIYSHSAQRIFMRLPSKDYHFLFILFRLVQDV